MLLWKGWYGNMKHMNTPPTSLRLKLQLHAHVSNPYTENLVKNRKVTASMAVNTPTGSLGSSSSSATTVTITVPQGVTVLRFIDTYIGVTPGKTYTVSKYITQQPWGVGVLSSASSKYWWLRYVPTQDLAIQVASNLVLQFFYSPEINQQTPTVTDY